MTCSVKATEDFDETTQNSEASPANIANLQEIRQFSPLANLILRILTITQAATKFHLQVLTEDLTSGIADVGFEDAPNRLLCLAIVWSLFAPSSFYLFPAYNWLLQSRLILRVCYEI